MKLGINSTLRWVIGGTVAGALILWVHLAVGWGTLLSPWLRMPPGLLLGAFTLVATSYVIRALRIYDYFPQLRADLPATLRLSFLHTLANNLLPMRLGEAVFPVLMKRYFDVPLMDGGLSLLWIRLLDLYFIGLIAITAIALRTDAVLLWALLSLALAALPGFLWLRGPLAARLARLPGKLGRILNQALAQVPAQRGQVVRILVWTALSWVTKIGGFALVVKAFVELDLGRTLIGIVGAELSSVLPVHGVGGAGSYEGAMTLALLPFGVSAETALTAAVNLHLFLLGCTLLLGAVGALLRAPAQRTRYA